MSLLLAEMLQVLGEHWKWHGVAIPKRGSSLNRFWARLAPAAPGGNGPATGGGHADGQETKHLRDLIDTVYFPHVHADQHLHLALERMGAEKLDVLPVVSRANIHEMMGVIVLPNILELYGVERRQMGRG